MPPVRVPSFCMEALRSHFPGIFGGFVQAIEDQLLFGCEHALTTKEHTYKRIHELVYMYIRIHTHARARALSITVAMTSTCVLLGALLGRTTFLNVRARADVSHLFIFRRSIAMCNFLNVRVCTDVFHLCTFKRLGRKVFKPSKYEG